MASHFRLSLGGIGWLCNMRGSQSSLKRFRVVPTKSSPLQRRMCSNMQNAKIAALLVMRSCTKLSEWYGKSVCLPGPDFTECSQEDCTGRTGEEGFRPDRLNIHFQLTGAFMLRSEWGCGIPAEGSVEKSPAAEAGSLPQPLPPL